MMSCTKRGVIHGCRAGRHESTGSRRARTGRAETHLTGAPVTTRLPLAAEENHVLVVDEHGVGAASSDLAAAGDLVGAREGGNEGRRHGVDLCAKTETTKSCAGMTLVQQLWQARPSAQKRDEATLTAKAPRVAITLVVQSNVVLLSTRDLHNLLAANRAFDEERLALHNEEDARARDVLASLCHVTVVQVSRAPDRTNQRARERSDAPCRSRARPSRPSRTRTPCRSRTARASGSSPRSPQRPSRRRCPRP